METDSFAEEMDWTPDHSTLVIHRASEGATSASTDGSTKIMPGTFPSTPAHSLWSKPINRAQTQLSCHDFTNQRLNEGALVPSHKLGFGKPGASINSSHAERFRFPLSLSRSAANRAAPKLESQYTSSLAAFRELEEIGRRFQIGSRESRAAVSQSFPSDNSLSQTVKSSNSVSGKHPFAQAASASSSLPPSTRLDFPTASQKLVQSAGFRSSLSQKQQWPIRSALSPVHLSKITKLISSPWKTSSDSQSKDYSPPATTLHTPSKLKKSVVFAESPRTGRVKTATKRFYIGEPINSPGPSSQVLSEDSYLSNDSPTQRHSSIDSKVKPSSDLRQDNYANDEIPVKNRLLFPTLIDTSDHASMKHAIETIQTELPSLVSDEQIPISSSPSIESSSRAGTSGEQRLHMSLDGSLHTEPGFTMHADPSDSTRDKENTETSTAIRDRSSNSFEGPVSRTSFSSISSLSHYALSFGKSYFRAETDDTSPVEDRVAVANDSVTDPRLDEEDITIDQHTPELRIDKDNAVEIGSDHASTGEPPADSWLGSFKILSSPLRLLRVLDAKAHGPASAEEEDARSEDMDRYDLNAAAARQLQCEYVESLRTDMTADSSADKLREPLDESEDELFGDSKQETHDGKDDKDGKYQGHTPSKQNSKSRHLTADTYLQDELDSIRSAPRKQDAFLSKNPLVDESDDELAADHVSDAMRTSTDLSQDATTVHEGRHDSEESSDSSRSDQPVESSESSPIRGRSITKQSSESVGVRDTNAEIKASESRETSPDLPSRLNGLTLLKSPAIIPSPRRSSRRLSISRKYRAEKILRAKALADQYARDHGILRKTQNPMVTALSRTAEVAVQEALSRRQTEIVAITSTRIEISRRDIGKVLPQARAGDDSSGWLNDEIIGAYLQCVVDYGNEKRRKPNGPPKYHAFNTFFYSKLSGRRGYDDVKRWATKAKIGGKDLLKVEYVFIPINRGGSHWGLGVVSPIRRTIEYFDSLHYPARAVYDNIQKFLSGELSTAYHEKEWRIIEDPDFPGVGKGPSQDNARDCGVFASTTAKLIVLGVDPAMVDAKDMPLQRRRMVAEIINGGFKGDFTPEVHFVYENLE